MYPIPKTTSIDRFFYLHTDPFAVKHLEILFTVAYVSAFYDNLSVVHGLPTISCIFADLKKGIVRECHNFTKALSISTQTVHVE